MNNILYFDPGDWADGLTTFVATVTYRVNYKCTNYKCFT